MGLLRKLLGVAGGGEKGRREVTLDFDGDADRVGCWVLCGVGCFERVEGFWFVDGDFVRHGFRSRSGAGEQLVQL